MKSVFAKIVSGNKMNLLLNILRDWKSTDVLVKSAKDISFPGSQFVFRFKSIILNIPKNSCHGYFKVFSNFFDRFGTMIKFFKNFFLYDYFISLVVFRSMFSVRRIKFKIFNSIVNRVSIYMVNALSWFKGTAKMLGHYISMCQNPSIFISIGMCVDIQSDIFSRLMPSFIIDRFVSFPKLGFRRIRNSFNKSSVFIPWIFHKTIISYMTQGVKEV